MTAPVESSGDVLFFQKVVFFLAESRRNNKNKAPGEILALPPSVGHFLLLTDTADQITMNGCRKTKPNE